MGGGGCKRVGERGGAAARTRAINKLVNADLWICASFATFRVIGWPAERELTAGFLSLHAGQ